MSLDHGQFMEGTPLDLALNLGCEMSQCLCKATSDIITSSENSSGNLHLPKPMVESTGIVVYRSLHQKSIFGIRDKCD